jgi:hypothetical protein
MAEACCEPSFRASVSQGAEAGGFGPDRASILQRKKPPGFARRL